MGGAGCLAGIAAHPALKAPHLQAIIDKQLRLIAARDSAPHPVSGDKRMQPPRPH